MLTRIPQNDSTNGNNQTGLHSKARVYSKLHWQQQITNPNPTGCSKDQSLKFRVPPVFTLFLSTLESQLYCTLPIKCKELAKFDWLALPLFALIARSLLRERRDRVGMRA